MDIDLKEDKGSYLLLALPESRENDKGKDKENYQSWPTSKGRGGYRTTQSSNQGLGKLLQNS